MTDATSQLLAILDSLGEQSRFCTSGRLPPVLPGLRVRGAGEIAAPISAAAAKAIIHQAAEAPYGRGEETIVDLKVRRVFQLEPEQFSLRNAQWKPFLAGIVAAVRKDFGIDREVEAHLYKLLVYERGSFFAPHRDTEKTPGMFGTLIVCLPSRHTGGTLAVSHDGATERIDCGGAGAEFEVRYAAFYADCRHEITPVTAGYRVCLVYNLAVAGRKRQPAAPMNGPAAARTIALLPGLFSDGERDKAAFLLKHQYSEAGLDPTALKGADRSLLDVLARAAASLDYAIHLALLMHRQEGSVDYSTWGGGDYGYRSRHSRYDDFDDEEGGEEGGEESSGESFDEIIDESLTLDHWVSPSGRKRRLGKMNLERHEVVSSVDEEDRPHQQAIHEATGNEGATMERWYQLGAIVLWPRDRYVRILAAEGPETSIPALERMMAKAKGEAAIEACRGFAAAIVDRWPERFGYQGTPSRLCARMLKIIEKLDAAALAERFIREALPAHADGSEGPALFRVLNRFGWKENAAALEIFMTEQKPEFGRSLFASARLLEALCCRPPAYTPERRAVCAALAQAFEEVVGRFDDSRAYGWQTETSGRDRAIESVFRICSALNDSQRLDRFVTRVLSRKDRYPLHAVIIPAVQALGAMGDAESVAMAPYSRLREHCLAELRERTAARIAKPSDWRREAEIACTCRDCRELVQFLKDPVEKVHRFPVGKDRRRHLHGQIAQHGCDLTHVTERRGRPETLVCRKTSQSYERRHAQFAVDVRLLKGIEKQFKGR